ncbi:MAG: cbb3-type cytochrome oxidase assembly protein CcoS [Neisseriaceae bacterium]|nr:cbb3-type cytochrome oxidase assembly protein CcoS [Neisseriaceae bacterium]MBR3481354.1 cbb3-type cytochrome oxidase assembly protein CcoS [Neisseriaceae bacterium]
MESIYILIPISIVLVLLIGVALWWSSKSGQFDDLEGPGHRILMDDDDTTHLLSGSLKDNQGEKKNE